MRHRMLLYAKSLQREPMCVKSAKALECSLPHWKGFLHLHRRTQHEICKSLLETRQINSTRVWQMPRGFYTSCKGAAPLGEGGPHPPTAPGTRPVAQGRHQGALLLLRQVGGGKLVSLKKPQRPLFPNQQIKRWRNLKRRKPRAPSHPHTAPWRHSCGSITIN